MIKQSLIFLIFVSGLVFGGYQLFYRPPAVLLYPTNGLAQRSTALVFQETTSLVQLTDRYRAGKLRVLIVPGHDNQFSGAYYAGNREADLNIQFARYLADTFAHDENLDVVVARDLLTGFYYADILKLFDHHRESILNFRSVKKFLMDELLAKGTIEERSTNNHSFATDEISQRLYGINKWANDNHIDLIIHIHFNDYPRKYKGAGKYRGVAIFVPDNQYPNAKPSLKIGQDILASLAEVRPISNNPLEKAGVIPSQELIAVGSNASVNAAAILIEYGYVYEPDFVDPVAREKMFKVLAEKTYFGLKKALESM